MSIVKSLEDLFDNAEVIQVDKILSMEADETINKWFRLYIETSGDVLSMIVDVPEEWYIENVGKMNWYDPNSEPTITDVHLNGQKL